MSNDLVLQTPQPLWPAGMDAARVLRAFEAGKSPLTIKRYGAALRTFAKWFGHPQPKDCVLALIAGGPGNANAVVLDYRDMLAKKYAPAYVNVHLFALKHLIDVCNVLCIIQWKLMVPSVPVVALRDTRGCGHDGWKKLLAKAQENPDHLHRLRDVALLHCLFDCALRREEVFSLDLEHWNPKRPGLYVLGKKRTQREWFTTPPATVKAINEYVALRGAHPGSLFSLSYKGVWFVVHTLGVKAGVKAWPHAVRHASITHGLDVTGGDIRAVQRFARHANPSTTMRYDDNRRDLAGEVARKISEDDDDANSK